MIFSSSSKQLNKSWEIVLHEANANYRQWLQELWKNYAPYAPDDFQYHIENDIGKLNSFIWEMLLANTLLEAGFTLKKVASDSPDICISYKGINVWIECNVPQKGDPSNPNSVPEKEFDGNAHLVQMDKNTLRIANALGVKKEQYASWLKRGICKKSEPFIIALHGLELDFRIHNRRPPDIFRALYGMGDMFVTFDTASDFKEEGYMQTPSIKKSNKSTIETTFFCNGKNTEITGVIYSKDWFAHACSANPPKYCYVKNISAINPTPIPFKNFAQEYLYEDGAISVCPEN